MAEESLGCTCILSMQLTERQQDNEISSRTSAGRCKWKQVKNIQASNDVAFVNLTLCTRYLMIFLKFVQAVIPTIEYDYTRHFTI